MERPNKAHTYQNLTSLRNFTPRGNVYIATVEAFTESTILMTWQRMSLLITYHVRFEQLRYLGIGRKLVLLIDDDFSYLMCPTCLNFSFFKAGGSDLE